MAEITLKELPPRPRPGDDRLTRGEVRVMWLIALTLTLPAVIIIGGIAIGLVVVGEAFLPSPQAMIRIVP